MEHRPEPLLNVTDLTVSFDERTVVQHVHYKLDQGETLAIVGASGSGKSVSSLALMGLLPRNGKVVSGSAIYHGKGEKCDLLSLEESAHRQLRGKEIAMIFQEPMTALNPVYRCGVQVAEVLRLHTGMSKGEARTRVVELFEQTHIPEPSKAYDKYPHQMSGGQKQRVMIAMAMSCSPRLIIADEPTTALDVTVQNEILALLQELQKQRGMGMLFITHDLGVVEDIADRVVVMHQGKVVEEGTMHEVLRAPEQAYTKGLINARPPLDTRPKRLPTVEEYLSGKANPETEVLLSTEAKRVHVDRLIDQAPLVSVRGLSKSFSTDQSLFKKKDQAVQVLRALDFDIYPGETLGLVGGSGSGKTTLGRTILQLIKPDSGSVTYDGQELAKMNESALRSLRREIQLIFQDPYSSLNPRIPIGAAMMEVMRVHHIKNTKAERRQHIEALLDQVGLEAAHYDRYPHEFSGGQRQRVVIARTLCVDPKLIICDESVSALDVSVQAQVLNLLNELKEEHGLTYVFISHDMAVVKYMSDRMIVLDKGAIAEMGHADKLFDDPQAQATKNLIDAIPGKS